MFSFFGAFVDPAPGIREQLLRRWPDIDIVAITSPFHGIAARFPQHSYRPADEDLPESIAAEIRRISTAYRGIRFLLLRTECWGGGCTNWGQVIRDGQLVYRAGGEEALRRLIGQFGVDIGPKEIFRPLYRDFPWKAETGTAQGSRPNGPS